MQASCFGHGIAAFSGGFVKPVAALIGEGPGAAQVGGESAVLSLLSAW